MNRIRLLVALLLLLSTAGHIACHNDQRIVDQHRQILEDEDD
jgi:hypothetical protein